MLEKTDPIQILVCDDCDLRSDAENTTKACERCGISFCAHNASRTDFRYCRDCFEDFHVIETIETKITSYTNNAGQITTRRKQIAKNLKLTGTDWLFANTQISLLTDEELMETIEYHRAIASVMLLEREERRTDELNKLSRVKIQIRKRDDVDSTGALKVKKAPKEKKASNKDKATDAKVADALQKLATLKPEDLAALLTTMGIK